MSRKLLHGTAVGSGATFLGRKPLHRTAVGSGATFLGGITVGEGATVAPEPQL